MKYNYDLRCFENEDGKIIDEVDLKGEYYHIEYMCLKRDHDTEAETFADYLENCTSKNGTLTEVQFFGK